MPSRIGDLTNLAALTAAGTDLLEVEGTAFAFSNKITVANFFATINTAVTSTALITGAGLTATVSAANTAALLSTGFSSTGSDATAMVNLSGTWNTSGVITAFKVNVTDTARGAGSLLFQLNAGAAGATSEFSVSNVGAVVAAGSISAGTNLFLGGAGQFISYSGAGKLTSSADGIHIFQNNGQNGYTRLAFGLATTGFAALGISTTTMTVVRGDGTSGAAFLVNGTALGFAAGSGAAVTQLSTRTTGVTINTACGTITTNATSLAALASATFTVTNSAVAIGDVVNVCIQSGSTANTSFPIVTTVAAGSFNLTLYNRNAATADTAAMLVNFVVLKGVSA